MEVGFWFIHSICCFFSGVEPWNLAVFTDTNRAHVCGDVCSLLGSVPYILLIRQNSKGLFLIICWYLCICISFPLDLIVMIYAGVVCYRKWKFGSDVYSHWRTCMYEFTYVFPWNVLILCMMFFFLTKCMMFLVPLEMLVFHDFRESIPRIKFALNDIRTNLINYTHIIARCIQFWKDKTLL